MTLASFGHLEDGREVDRVVLQNQHISLGVITYGARLQVLYLRCPTAEVDVLPGYDTIAEYEKDENWMGSLCGPVFGRIPDGKFVLDGELIQMPKNQPNATLHSGTNGYHRRLFKVETVTADSVTLYLHDAEGECNLPGNVDYRVTYSLEGKSLRVRHEATTDKARPMCVNSHVYLNLEGVGHGTVENHIIQVNAALFLDKDGDLFSSGAVLPVQNTDLDFRTPARLGDRMHKFSAERGLDHSFVMTGDKTKLAAILSCNNISCEVYTNQLDLHLYTANFFEDISGKSAKNHIDQDGVQKYPMHGAIGLECQGFPGAAAIPHFPSIWLRPGVVYNNDTVFKFVF